MHRSSLDDTTFCHPRATGTGPTAL